MIKELIYVCKPQEMVYFSMEYKYIYNSVLFGDVQALIPSVVGSITPILAVMLVISREKEKKFTILLLIELAIHSFIYSFTILPHHKI